MTDPVRERLRLEGEARRKGMDVKFIWTAVHDDLANATQHDTAAANKRFSRLLCLLHRQGVRR